MWLFNSIVWIAALLIFVIVFQQLWFYLDWTNANVKMIETTSNGKGQGLPVALTEVFDWSCRLSARWASTVSDCPGRHQFRVPGRRPRLQSRSDGYVDLWRLLNTCSPLIPANPAHHQSAMICQMCGKAATIASIGWPLSASFCGAGFC